jgi:uncharacterized protein
MDTRQQLDAALKDAMRANDEMRKQTVRMVLSAVKFAEVEKGARLDDASVIAVIQKEIKSRAEAMQDAQKAGRQDLSEKAQTEVNYLQTFLPQQLTTEELDALAREAVQETGASSPADMGRVMKAIMQKVQGRASGDQVSQAVRRLLTT